MDKLFSEICHVLLSGQVIDEMYHPALYDKLNRGDVLYSVNAFLEKIERRCVATQSGSGFYCVYGNAQGNGVQAAVRQQFQAWVKVYEPLLRWLRLCRGVQENDSPLRSGELIRHADLLQHITQSARAREQLGDIVRLLERSSSGGSNHLRSVLDYLEKERFLQSLDSGKLTYRATAKWDLLYEQLAFIAACENIPLETAPGTQEEWL